MPLAQFQLDVNAVGDLLRPPQGIVHARKRGVHLLGTAEEELVRLHPHAVGVGAELAGVDAEQDVLSLGVFAVDVVDVAGGDQGNSEAFGHAHGPVHHRPLRFQVVVLNLDVIIVAEELAIPGGDFEGFCEVRLAAGQQRAAQLAGGAAAEADEPFAVGGQQFFIDSRLEIESFQKGGGGELHKISEASGIAGQERQVVAVLFRAAPFFMEAAARGNIRLDAEDRIDAQFPSGLIELDCPVQISMIGQRQGCHSQGFCPFEQSPDRAGAVQEAVVAMTMQMGERKCAHGFLHAASVGLTTVFYRLWQSTGRTSLL